MKKAILACLLMFAPLCTQASNLDNVTEVSVQLPIAGSYVVNGSNWFKWEVSDIAKLDQRINTFIIHPVTGDLSSVRYTNCTSNSCAGYTKQYLTRAAEQMVAVLTARPGARIYIGTPYAAEADVIPTIQQMRGYLVQLNKELLAKERT